MTQYRKDKKRLLVKLSSIVFQYYFTCILMGLNKYDRKLPKVSNLSSLTLIIAKINNYGESVPCNRLLPPPDGLIEEIFETLNLTCSEFAVRLGIEPEQLKQVIEGESPIDANLALRLERALENPSAEVWLRMQAQYDLRKAKLSIDLSQVKAFPPTHVLQRKSSKEN